MVAALTTVLTMVLPAGLAHGVSPVEEEPEFAATLTLDSLRPLLPSPKRPLRLAGVVTNTGTSALTGVTVALRFGERINNRSTLTEITDERYFPTTRGVNNGSFTLDTELAPGASVPWSMTIAAADLGFYSNGVYFMRLDLLAANTTLNSVRTFLPWFPDPDSVQPTKVVWLWPMADLPNRDAANVFLNDRTPNSFNPNERLSRLLSLGMSNANQVEWVFDPEMLQSAQLVADGYQVRGASGPVDIPSSQAAVQWLNSARSGLTTASIHASAYADPDVTALTRAGLDQDVVLATATATSQLGTSLNRSVGGPLGWPPGARTDQRTLDLLQKSGVRTVVLPEAALPVSNPSDAPRNATALLRTESGPMQAVLTDPVLSESLGKAADTPSQALLARQRFLAETGVLATSSNGEPPVLVVGPDQRWDPNSTTVSQLLDALTRSAFARLVPLRTLLGSEVAENTRSLAPVTATARREGLRNDYLEQVEDVQRKLRLFATIIENPGVVTEPFSSALLRTTSGAWRTNRPEGTDLLNTVNAELDASIGKVRLLSGGVINISGDGGRIPITIANDLPVPVKVGVRLQGDPAVRLVSSPLEPMTIPANRKISTEISAKVVGAGDLQVDAQLVSPTGAAYGQPVELVLRSTAYALAATWVVLVAFVILSVLLIINSIRRRRNRRETDEPANGIEQPEDANV